MADHYTYLPFEIDKVQYAMPLEDVAYIIAASDEAPRCTPPKRNPCVTCVMNVGDKLLTVVELTAIGKSDFQGTAQNLRPFILALNYQNSLIGLLADYIFPPVEFHDLKIKRDTINRRTFLMNGEKEFVLFNVSEFYNQISTGYSSL